jgi:amino acid transporter
MTMPSPNFMLIFLNPNPIWSVLVSLMFLANTYASAMGLSIAPVRNLFAYSFDRIIPTWFSKTDRRGSPWTAVFLGTICDVFFFLIFMFAGTWILYSITSWFFAWIIISVVGMLFVLTGRGKQIFAKSPEIVEKKIGGVPIMLIWAVCAFVVSVGIDYYTLIPFLNGSISSLNLWITLIIFVFPPFFVYYT